MSTRPRHDLPATVKRRRFIALLAAGVLGAPLAVEAQQTAGVAKIGILFSATQASTAANLEAFRQGLLALGHVEGQTFALEIRYGDARPERLPDLARELVRLKPSVILATTDLAIAAVKKQTATIPIVMSGASDPVATGFAANLGRPGGNVTGLSTTAADLSGKQLQLLTEAVPGLTRVAFLWNPDVRGAVLAYKDTDGAARSLHLQLHSVEVSHAEEFDRAFSAILEQRAQAVVFQGPNPVAFSNRTRIASFTQKHRLPSMYPTKLFVDDGGLMSYGPSILDLIRRATTYVDKILKGAKPADLPIEQPTKFELVINVKTAKALGLTIPQALLLKANQVIQ